LRIRVVGGGCSGMSYELGWDDTAGADDNITEVHGVKVFVDSKSAPYLQGSEIDYVDNNMLGAGFAINNPNVKSSCGCGHPHEFWPPTHEGRRPPLRPLSRSGGSRPRGAGPAGRRYGGVGVGSGGHPLPDPPAVPPVHAVRPRHRLRLRQSSASSRGRGLSL